MAQGGTLREGQTSFERFPRVWLGRASGGSTPSPDSGQEVHDLRNWSKKRVHEGQLKTLRFG